MATVQAVSAQTALSGYPKQITVTCTITNQPPITWSLVTPPSGVTITQLSDTSAIVTVNRQLTSLTPVVLSITVAADEDGEDQSTATFSCTVSPRPTSPAVLQVAGVL
jgi:hypothetical protein